MPDTLLQFGPFLIWVAVSLPPAIILLRRCGLSSSWAAVCLIPVAGPIILLWIVAYRRWGSRVIADERSNS